MIHLLLLLIFLACVGIVGAWIAENPGAVTITWFDYRIDTSLALLFVLSIIAGVSLAYGALAVRRLILAPHLFARRHTLRGYRNGLTELTYSVAALAASDIAGAEAHTRKAERLLGRTPLTLLLAAQIARSRGDDDATRALLTQMLDHKETEYLAARSLSDAAGKQKLFPQALELAQRAQALHPGELGQVISLHIRLGQWQEALAAIRAGTRKGQISRQAIRRYRGLVYLTEGSQLLHAGHPEGTLLAARNALKDLPDFVPAVIFAARAYAEANQTRKGVKLLTAAWKKNPHPQLVDALRAITAREPREAQMRLLDKLSAIHPIPSHSQEQWTCGGCGQATNTWQAHCPSCGAFDALEWKKRDLRFVAA